VAALGGGLAHLGTPGFWRRHVYFRASLRTPGVTGVEVAFVSIPLILLLPRAGLAIAFAALCLYPLLEAPRVASRPSWWGAATVATLVWLVVFGRWWRPPIQRAGWAKDRWRSSCRS
jgi:hypothetical protein